MEYSVNELFLNEQEKMNSICTGTRWKYLFACSSRGNTKILKSNYEWR